MTIPAFVPQIGALAQGLDWDMTIRERASHDNEVTDHPIEDTFRSFITDHNREKPVRLTVSLTASTISITSGSDIDRPARLYQNLLELRARQTVDPNSFVTVFTGLRIFEDMVITSIRELRDSEEPNSIRLEIGFKEIRLGQAPRLDAGSILHNASNGSLQGSRGDLVNFADRFVIEATIPRRRPRTGPIPDNLQSAVFTSASSF